MAQERIITDVDYLELSRRTAIFRYSVFPGRMELTRAITPLGADGTEGVDYVIVERYNMAGSLIWRMAVRDGYWYKDYTLTATGFAGTEGVDWGWFERSKLQ